MNRNQYDINLFGMEERVFRMSDVGMRYFQVTDIVIKYSFRIITTKMRFHHCQNVTTAPADIT